MNRIVYGQRQLPTQYDERHAIVYLNEESVDDFQPSEVEGAEPIPGFAYSGPMGDGGTLIECADVQSRDLLINGVIRSMYTQTQEDAIKTHQLQVLRGDDLTPEKIAEYNSEWEAFDALRRDTIALVDQWIS